MEKQCQMNPSIIFCPKSIFNKDKNRKSQLIQIKSPIVKEEEDILTPTDRNEKTRKLLQQVIQKGKKKSL